MGIIGLQIPQIGQPNSTEAPKIANDFTTLQTVINGNLDSNNIAASLAASAGVNAGATVKGAVVNAGPGTRTNTAYGALNDAPDSVTVTLATNGLIAVWFQATWQESQSGQARAAIFVGANQLQVQTRNSTIVGPAPETSAAMTVGVTANTSLPLASTFFGLVTLFANLNTSADVSTGQAVGIVDGKNPLSIELGGSQTPITGAVGALGGPCYIFAAAGTYAISVQYKAAFGTVTVSNRRLWVAAESYS